MNHLILFCFVSTAFLGCDTKKEPHNLISEDKMIEVLYDVYIINATTNYQKRTIEANGIFPSDYVLRKHQIDSIQFAKSNNFYATDIITYKSILENVKKRLEINKKEIETVLETKKQKKDSIYTPHSKKRDTLNFRDSLINPKKFKQFKEFKEKFNKNKVRKR